MVQHGHPHGVESLVVLKAGRVKTNLTHGFGVIVELDGMLCRAKKKGAVIGSAPKLSHEGLVAAAKAAEDKAATEQRALQLAAKKAAAAEVKANKKKPKLAAPGGSIDFNLSQLSNHLLCLYQLLPPLWLRQHLVRCQLLILRPSKANVSRKKQ